MRTTRILRAKRDSDPLFPKEPCQIFFFSTPLILSLYVIPSYQINSAQSGSWNVRAGKDRDGNAPFFYCTNEETEAR